MEVRKIIFLLTKIKDTLEVLSVFFIQLLGCPVLLESIQFYEIESRVGVNSFVIQQMFSDTPGLLSSVEKCLAEKEKQRQEL